MTRLRVAFPAALLSVLLLLASACEQGVFESLPRAKVVRYTAGTPVMVAQATVGVDGAVLEAPAGSPLAGVKVTVPPGAVRAPAKFWLGYEEGTWEGIAADAWDGPTILLDTDGAHVFDQALRVEYPKAEPAKVAVAYYVRPDGTLELLQTLKVEGQPGRAAFETWHASAYVHKNKSPGSPAPVWNGFAPATDGFQVINDVTHYTPNARCFGMAAFARWFKETMGGGLVSRYGESVPTKAGGENMKGQEVVADRAHNSVALRSSPLTVQDPEVFVTSVTDALSMGAVGVLVGMDNPAHVVLAVAYTDNQIGVYDSNHLGIYKGIDYDLRASPPTVAYGKRTELAAFGGEAVFNEDYAHVMLDAAAGFHGENETKIEITSHTDPSQKVTEAEQTLEGKVYSGQLLVDELELHLKYADGTLAEPKKLPIPQNDPTFSFPVTLRAGKNELWFKAYGKVASVGRMEAKTDHAEGKFNLVLEAGAQGNLTFDWTPTVHPTTFHIEALAKLTLADDGPDETNYDMSGTATMKTKTFNLYGMPNTVCTLDDAEKAFKDTNFKVLKTPGPAVRFGFIQDWSYTCVGPGGAQPTLIILSFFTGQGTACQQWVDVPISDPLAPMGTYTTNCSGSGTATATWNFSKNP